jgi:hypothetical protein
LAQSITPRVPPGQLCQDRGDQPFRWKRHRHRIQALEQTLQSLELSAGVRVVLQQPLELLFLVRRGRAVENLMHALYQG